MLSVSFILLGDIVTSFYAGDGPSGQGTVSIFAVGFANFGAVGHMQDAVSEGAEESRAFFSSHFWPYLCTASLSSLLLAPLVNQLGGVGSRPVRWFCPP